MRTTLSFPGTEPGCVQWSYLLLQGICTVPKWAGGEDGEGKGGFHFEGGKVGVHGGYGVLLSSGQGVSPGQWLSQ